MATTATVTSSHSFADPTGAAGWSVATISQETVTNSQGVSTNVENVYYGLRPTAAGALPGVLSIDYLIGANGQPNTTPLDSALFSPSGVITQTYYTNEALNPFLAPAPATATTPAFSPPNPGYVFTQYTTANGAVTAIAINANGQTYSGTALSP